MQKKLSKTLRQLWEQKLKDSGFIDIEQTFGTVRQLKQYEAHYFYERYTPEEFSAKQKYFEQLRAATHRLKFSSDRHKYVWKLYAHGIPIRQIAAKSGYNRRSVDRLLKKYKKELPWL